MSNPQAASALYRERVLKLARAQERLRQANSLAWSAMGDLAELSGSHGVDLKIELKLTTDARKACADAVERLEGQIARTPTT